MGRRHTAGVVGYQAVGGVQVDNTTFTAADNLDIVMDPSGTGLFKIAGDAQLQAQGDLRFADSDSSNYVAFQAPATIATNYTLTLPNSDGSSSQVLTTNGSGTLSWTTPAVTITDNTTDSGTNYVAFTTATSGTITAARVSSTKLTFQPSTGLLNTTELTVNGTARSLRLENVKTANHTLEEADRNKVVAMNNSSSATVTIPNDSTYNFPIGSVVYIAKVSSGSVTLAGAAGVTVTRVGDFVAGEELYVRKRAANSWITVDQSKTLAATGGTISSAGGYTIHTYTSGSSTFVLA